VKETAMQPEFVIQNESLFRTR